LAQQLRVYLKSVSHIFGDTKSMLDSILQQDVSARDMLVKADVKDFYLSGQPGVLAQYCSAVVPSHLRAAVFETTLFLLSNQFVRIGDEASQNFFQLKQGSGMGFVCSDEIANVGFVTEVEAARISSQSWRAE